MTPRPNGVEDSPLAPDVDPAAEPRRTRPVPPDLSKTSAAVESPRARSLGITILAVLAVLYTLYFAREFLVPVAFALLLSFLFGPVVRALARAHVRPPLGAAIVVLALLGLAGLGVYELAGPVQSWAGRAPQTISATQRRLHGLLRPIERVSKTTEQVASTASNVAGTGGARTPEVVVRPPSVLSRVFGTTQRLLAGALEVLILLYFLLAGGDLFLQKLVKVLPDPHDKQKAVEIARQTEASISTYLITAATVNLAEGAVVAGAMYILGMPNAILWGALVMLLEFIPYLGALTALVILTIAAATTFENVGHIVLVPATYLTINLVQANLASPLLLGHRLELNPVALLLGIAFWFWVWGIAGAFIAVPLMAAFKIVCDHVEALASVGEFLGTREPGERRAILR
ncbi:MAG TPA: AI-2E family transporter [Longimicrobiaceae bacterium]|nr:AI-2E family transporter [Longimicrobiaceae bacterium]